MFTCADEERDMMPPRGEVENIIITFNIFYTFCLCSYRWLQAFRMSTWDD